MTDPTPVTESFHHRSVLAQEAPDALVINPDGLYVDATFGRGGHSRRILAKLSAQGRLIAFDRDPEAIAAAADIDDPRFCIIHSAFSDMKGRLAERGITRVDGILMDIGVSSPQIDDAQRGFSFRYDGPLDMRMDTDSGRTAAQWLAVAGEQEITRVLRDFGEERFARNIARAILERRAVSPIERTGDLASIIARAIPRSKQDPKQNPATRSFQAIRIFINGELDELTQAMNEAGDLLTAGSRLVIISFHSLEDRLVKRFFEAGAHPDRGIDTRIALRQQDLPLPWWDEVERVKPQADECEENGRSRSAVMRYARRTERAWEAGAGGRECD